MAILASAEAVPWPDPDEFVVHLGGQPPEVTIPAAAHTAYPRPQFARYCFLGHDLTRYPE